jgi:RNA polymerase sigma-70 factor, ECF subfamily
MRAAADFLSEVGAHLRSYTMSDGQGGAVSVPGLHAMARADGERSGNPDRGQNKTLGAAGRGSASSAEGPAKGRFSGPGEEPESSLEIDERAQQNEDAGVEDDMATLVLDNAVLDNPVRGGVRPAISATIPEANPGPYGVGAAAADPSSDAAVMLRVAAGDEAGFNYLVGKYHRPMINFLYRMVHNQAVAEELAQEVFLRVYRSRESYRAEAKFTTWLYRIATNLAVNQARDTKHERAAQNVYLDAPDEETGTTPEVADSRPSVEQSLLKDERMAAIRKHVMALPERQRTAVLMHKYQGLDYRQIGEVLKLSESATKSLLFRAYQSLREKLKEFA